MEKLGIESLKKVIDLGGELVKVGKQVAANGNNYGADLALALGELPVLTLEIPALVAAWPSIPGEVKDLDAEEGAELVAYVVAKFAVDDAKAVAIANAALGVVIKGYELAKAIQA